MEAWPNLTSAIPGIALRYKSRPEDFIVEELPAYTPSGTGEHVYLWIEKRGTTTQQAVRDLARALGLAPRAIGAAGLKDAQGVTRQWLSLQHADSDRARAVELPKVRVLEVSRHANKLRIGHLRGNRFALKLRDVEPGREADLRAVLAELERRGAPNYFGEQRFGARGDSWEIGRALLAGDLERAVALIAGDPRPVDRGPVLRARELFARGEYEASARSWPGGFRDPIRLARAMGRKKGDAAQAIHAVDRGLLRFFVSAWQAWIFNAVVAARIGSLDRVLAGDLAWKHANGAVFRVEDAERESPRAAALEISPSGPLFGARMTAASGEPAAIEERALEEAGASRESFDRRGPWQPAGGRRPLRLVPVALAVDAGRDEHGPYLGLAFELDAGSYATALLREIHKGRGAPAQGQEATAGARGEGPG